MVTQVVLVRLSVKYLQSQHLGDRKENAKFEVSPGYKVRPCLKEPRVENVAQWQSAVADWDQSLAQKNMMFYLCKVPDKKKKISASSPTYFGTAPISKTESLESSLVT